MNWNKSPEQVEQIRQRFPVGTRIVVNCMENDPCPIFSGTKGVVQIVDDIGTVHCKFENGRMLGLIPGVDSFARCESEII